jgi:hypothetical protein
MKQEYMQTATNADFNDRVDDDEEGSYDDEEYDSENEEDSNGDVGSFYQPTLI